MKLALVAAVGLLNGCHPRPAAFATTAAGIGVMAYGMALTEGEHTDDRHAYAFGAGFAIVLFGIGWILYPEDKPATPAEVDPVQLAAQREREAQQAQAWELTKTAAEAARLGDCGAVAKLDAETRAIDPDFHATVFARDAGITRCLGEPQR